MSIRRRINLALPQFGDKYEMEKMRRLVEEIERLAMRGGAAQIEAGDIPPDILPDPVPGPKGDKGDPGEKGEKGDKGDKGDPGDSGAGDGEASLGTHYLISGLDSDIVDASVASICPADAGNQIVTTLADGDNLIGVFATSQYLPGLCVIDHGMWGGHVYYSANSASGENIVRIEVYKRTSEGVETKLFDIRSENLNSTSLADSLFWYEQQTPIKIETSERLVYKVYVERTGGSVQFTMYFNGHAQPTHIHTPFVPMSVNLRQLANLDCCGIIVRDCSVTVTGGSWEYSNVALQLLHVRQLRPTYVTAHEARQRPLIDVMPDFNVLTDARVSLYESTGTTYPIQPTDVDPERDHYWFTVLNNDLTNASRITLENAGNKEGEYDRRFHVRCYDPATNRHLSYFGTNDLSMNVYQNGSWIGEIVPEAGADENWASRAFPGGNYIDYANNAWRNGNLYMGLSGKFGPSSALSIGWNRICRWDNFSTTVRTTPARTVSGISARDIPFFKVYYAPDGSRLYSLNEEWSLVEYDADLNILSTTDMSVAQIGSTLPQAFAVLGDFFFVMQNAWDFDIWSIGDQTKLYDYSFTDIYYVVYGNPPPERIIPHPDGTVYVQRHGDDNAPVVHTFKFADATFVEETSSSVGFTCRGVVGENGIRVTNPRGQGGDITVGLDLDCCGVVVRDCTTTVTGGNWEYNNYNLSLVAQDGFVYNGAGSTTCGQPWIDWVDAANVSENDPRITAMDNTASSTRTGPYTIRDFNLNVVGSGEVPAQVDYTGATGGTFSDKRYYLGTGTGGIYYGINGNGPALNAYNSSFEYLGRFLPPEDAAGSGVPFGNWLIHDYQTLSNLMWARGGHIYLGVEKATATPGVDFDSIFRYPALPNGIAHPEDSPAHTARFTGVTDWPTTIGNSPFRMFVSDDGSRVYAYRGNGNHEIRVLDADLVQIDTIDCSQFFALQAGETTIDAFAILGDHIFFLYERDSTNRVLEVYSLTTSALLAQFFSPPGGTGVTNDTHQRILPHVSGKLFLIRQNIVSTFTWADATFVEEVSDIAGLQCRELVGADGRIVVDNGRGQGGNVTIDLAEVTQAETGELRAVTLDAYGRVVGNRAVTEEDLPGGGGVLPVVTGEVPPVFVYADDGSLIYTEI
ncbi:MAG: collagen-like protein [Halieaceae bacterium]|jgi:hypothetical protein|nr:collagen-like protein [Halieaceae bacterium]